jgi:hypothetical protein
MNMVPDFPVENSVTAESKIALLNSILLLVFLLVIPINAISQSPLWPGAQNYRGSFEADE